MTSALRQLLLFSCYETTIKEVTLKKCSSLRAASQIVLITHVAFIPCVIPCLSVCVWLTPSMQLNCVSTFQLEAKSVFYLLKWSLTLVSLKVLYSMFCGNNSLISRILFTLILECRQLSVYYSQLSILLHPRAFCLHDDIQHPKDCARVSGLGYFDTNLKKHEKI